jgi:signal transduction histidine kinase/CheY-like chemotaxis protein
MKRFRLPGFRDWSLARKLVVLILAAATLPLVAGVSVIVGEARARVREGASALLAARADQLATELDSFHRRHRAMVLYLARLGAERLGDDGSSGNKAAEFAATAASLVSSSADVRAAVLIDAVGRVVMSSDPTGLGRHVGERSYFRNALAGEVFISDVFVAPVATEPALIAFAAPVRVGATVIGVAALYTSAQAVWDLVKGTHARTGAGSEVVIYDRLGINIADSSHADRRFRPAGRLAANEKTRMLAEQRFGRRTAELIEAPAFASLQFTWARAAILPGEAQAPNQTAVPGENGANLLLARRLSSVPWTLFVIVPESSIYAPLDRLLARSLFASAIILAIALAASLAVCRNLLGPVRELGAATQALGKGDLSVRVPASSRDEIGLLGTRFNEMASAIATSRAQLEDRVRDRTADLERANSVLLGQHEALITQRATLESQQRELERKSVEVERADRLKSEFLANMSHELRTPLNSIIGFSELLLHESEATLPARQRVYLEDVLGSGKHLLGVIDDILNLSKIEAGHVSLELEAVNPSDVVSEACQILTATTRKRSLNITRHEATVPPVRADRAKTLQVLLNLLSNAVKFSPDGGRVHIAVEAAGPHVRFAVEDDGPGIPDALRDRLFQPFVQGERPLVKRHQGTGLGLAICKRLIEQQGGAIGVDTPARGARVWFELPVEGAAAVTEAVPREITAITPGPAPLAALPRRPLVTVLVVDDHDLNRELVRSVLERRGQTVLQARDGDEGVSLARTHRPDIVLMDLAMPKKDGFSATRELRADPTTREIPIVALTALAMRGDEERARAAGVDDYLTKPIDRKRLEETVDRFTAGRKAS